MSTQSRTRDTLAFMAILALCLAVSALGAVATASSVNSWYPLLVKPVFNPPNWVFAPVWSALYFMMAIAAWRVWRARGLPRARKALLLFCVQLALNLGWSLLFFGMRNIGAALVEIVILLLAIIATTVAFRRHDRIAGMLMLPYAAWVAYATLLNAALWHLN